MKKSLFIFVLLCISSLCFAHSFIRVDNVDEFGDPDGTYYYTLKSDMDGTFKNSSTSGKLKWNIRINQNGRSFIILKENGFVSDVTTSSRSGYYVDTDLEYTIKIKSPNNSIYTYYGSLVKDTELKYNALEIYTPGWLFNSYVDVRSNFAEYGKEGNGLVKISISSEYGSYSLGSLDVTESEKFFYDDTLYKEGLTLIDSGDYARAVDVFDEMKKLNLLSYNHYDVEKEMEKLRIKTKKFEAGDLLAFGKYNDIDIEWRVLDKQKDKALLISDKVLFSKEFSDNVENTTWENCTLRSYLNNEFYNSAFENEDRKLIIKNKVINSNIESDGADEKKYTEDYIFLLSYEEYNKYFSSDIEYEYNRNSGSSWWLRSLPLSSSWDWDSSNKIMVVVEYTSIGSSKPSNKNGVRPALWINL